MFHIVEWPVATRDPEDDFEFDTWVGQRLLEDAHAIAVAQMVRVLRLVAFKAEVADAHANEFHIVLVGEGMRQGFGEDFADGVDAHRCRRHIDRAGQSAWVEPQYPGSAGVGDALDSILAGGFEDIVGADEITLQHRLPFVAAGQAADMGYSVDVAGGFEQGVEVVEVGDEGVVEVGHFRAVVAADLVTGLEALGNGGAYAAGGAGDEYAHGIDPSSMGVYGVLVLSPKIGAGGLVAGSVFGGYSVSWAFAPRAPSRPITPALSPNDLHEKNLLHTLRPDLGKSRVFCGVPW